MKNPQQKQQKVLAPVAKAISTGAACLTMACTGPQVRPEPPAEPCPPGAVEAMEQLGIGIGDQEDAHLLLGRAGDPIFAKEGTTRSLSENLDHPLHYE